VCVALSMKPNQSKSEKSTSGGEECVQIRGGMGERNEYREATSETNMFNGSCY
jgi:hypothetical protein